MDFKVELGTYQPSETVLGTPSFPLFLRGGIFKQQILFFTESKCDLLISASVKTAK